MTDDHAGRVAARAAPRPRGRGAGRGAGRRGRRARHARAGRRALLMLVVGGVALPPLVVPPWLSAPRTGSACSRRRGPACSTSTGGRVARRRHAPGRDRGSSRRSAPAHSRSGPRRSSTRGRLGRRASAVRRCWPPRLSGSRSACCGRSASTSATYLDPTIYVAYGDTIGDLVMGGLGSAAAGAALVRHGGRARHASAGRRDGEGEAHASAGRQDGGLHVGRHDAVALALGPVVREAQPLVHRPRRVVARGRTPTSSCRAAGRAGSTRRTRRPPGR